MRTRSKGPWWSENLRWTSFLGPKSALERDFAVENGLRGTSGASLGETRYLARHALISAKPAAGQFDGTYGTVMGQQAVLTDSTADFWPRVPLQQPADRSRAPLHRLTPGFRMRGTERNNDMISVANAIQGPVVV